MTTADEVQSAIDGLAPMRTALDNADAMLQAYRDALAGGTTPPPPPPPPPRSKPQNVTATAIENGVRVQWTNVDPVPSTLVGTFIRVTNSAGYQATTTTAKLATEATFNNLTPGVSYNFAVAYDLGDVIPSDAYVTVSATPLAPPPPPPPPATANFTLDGARIVDPAGNTFVPRGINLTGAHSFVWDSFWNGHGKSSFWKDTWKLNAVRLVYCEVCASHSPGSQTYGTLSDFISEYTSKQMVVLIDRHEGVLGSTGGKTQTEVNQTIAFFEPLATTYKDNPYVWFQPYNEPQEEGWQVPASSAWVTYNEPVIAAIRATGNQNIICPNTSHYGQDRASGGGIVESESAIMTYGPQLLSKYKNIVFSLHFYSRWGDALCTDAIAQDYFARLRTKGLAVVCDETGAYDVGFEAVAGDRTGTQRLYRVNPPYVGIMPWFVGTGFAAPPGLGTDTSGPHWTWIQAQLSSGGGGTTPPPPTTRPKPQNITGTGIVNGVKITWTNVNPLPASLAGVFISYGNATQGYVGQTLVPVSQAGAAGATASYDILGLTPGTPYTFDVAYNLGDTIQTTDLTRIDGITPLSGTTPTPTPTGSYPISSDWNTKRAWIIGRVGCDKSGLKVIASQADLTANGLPGSWYNGMWSLGAGGPFSGLDVRGLVYYTGSAAANFTNCKFMGFQYAQESGRNGGTFTRCTVVFNPAIPLGQGAINFFGQTNWVVDRCDLSGFCDGIQCVGPGTIVESWIHGNVYGYSPVQGGPTHNDGVQNYGGNVNVLRSVLEIGGVAGSTNGCMFNSDVSATFTGTEVWCKVDRPDVNVLHAWGSVITINGGHIEGGRLIGDVRLINCERV